MLKRTTGFTLIELMIVVAIIAILAAVAIPKFGLLVARSREAEIRASLGSLRSALAIYYSDNQVMPTTLSNCLEFGGKYIAAIPPVQVPAISSQGNPGHPMTSGDAAALDDMASAAWIYSPNAGDSYILTVNCSHKDSKGSVWSTN